MGLLCNFLSTPIWTCLGFDQWITVTHHPSKLHPVYDSPETLDWSWLVKTAGSAPGHWSVYIRGLWRLGSVSGFLFVWLRGKVLMPKSTCQPFVSLPLSLSEAPDTDCQGIYIEQRTIGAVFLRKQTVVLVLSRPVQALRWTCCQ